MRAAEELLLKAKIYRLSDGHYIHDDGSRCAIGCLLPEDADGGIWSTMKAIQKKYRWMVTERDDLKCPRCGTTFQKMLDAVGHTFDHHVYATHEMTLEQLAEWIDQQDPTPRVPQSTSSEETALTR